MLRKLLACLAFLTGLAAAGTPVQAEAAVALASRIEASATKDLVSRPTSAVANPVLDPWAEPALVAGPQGRVESAMLQPPVRIGSDRARE